MASILGCGMPITTTVYDIEDRYLIPVMIRLSKLRPNPIFIGTQEIFQLFTDGRSVGAESSRHVVPMAVY